MQEVIIKPDRSKNNKDSKIPGFGNFIMERLREKIWTWVYRPFAHHSISLLFFLPIHICTIPLSSCIPYPRP